ncbi:MAG: DUF1249 domain-containing protein [Steroidobacteraceae bacterium]|nr:DUF1249 domain-containing protein [Steroidobacteraceae bacterium]
MAADQLCASSWRARPRSFVSLMTLYESNYIRLGWLVPDLRRATGALMSAAARGPMLEITVLEQCRYTTTLGMSYLFDDGRTPARDPGLEVRVYHDARLAEARGTGADPARPRLQRSAAPLADDHGRRWSCNMLLNKWLEYCAGSGHRFALQAR